MSRASAAAGLWRFGPDHRLSRESLHASLQLSGRIAEAERVEDYPAAAVRYSAGIEII
jgi:hypothetical protein